MHAGQVLYQSSFCFWFGTKSPKPQTATELTLKTKATPRSLILLPQHLPRLGGATSLTYGNPAWLLMAFPSYGPQVGLLGLLPCLPLTKRLPNHPKQFISFTKSLFLEKWSLTGLRFAFYQA